MKVIVILFTLPILLFVPLQSSAPVFLSSATHDIQRKIELRTKDRSVLKIVERDVHVLAIGDSLTDGFGDQSEGGGYVGSVKRALMRNPYVSEVKVENEAIIGLRSDQLLHQIKEDGFAKKLQDATIIFMTIGGNDLIHVVQNNVFSLTVDLFERERKEYESRLEEILKVIRRSNSNATIYVLGLFNPFSESLQELDEITDIVAGWNRTIQRVASKQKGSVYVPIDDIFTNDPTLVLYSDQFHPNMDGYEEIGIRLYTYFSTTSLPSPYQIVAEGY